MRLLVIEDDAFLRERLEFGLRQAGYEVAAASDGEAGLRLALEERFDLLILDLMLPLRDGWSVCQELRARRRAVPVLMLTALDAVPERIRGLDVGADDYLAKPFDFGELLARIRALLRREGVHKSRHIRIADLELDTGARSVHRGGQVVHLTPREYELLEALALSEGRTVTRERILEVIWRDDTSMGEVLLRVADTGEGVPEEALAHLTERFYRVDRARSRQDGGTGLGLAITQSILAAHRGRLEFEATPGGGLTAVVRLPRA